MNKNLRVNKTDSIWKASHLASFWNSGKMQLGNRLIAWLSEAANDFVLDTNPAPHFCE